MADKSQDTHETKVITSGGTVRIHSPVGRPGHKPPKVSIIVAPDEVVHGFVGFLREHAIVGLAVGFVIATQVQALVKQLISSFIDPLFTLFFGESLSKRTFTLHFHGHAANFGWGGFVYYLLDFLFVLAAIYAIIKLFKLDKLDKAKDDDPTD